MTITRTIITPFASPLPWERDAGGSRLWSLPFASMTFARASDALYQTGAATDGSSAYISTAGTDALVLEDLGDGAGALARFERSSTNLALRSREIDASPWTTFGAATITAGQGGPTGSDAERVEVAAGTNLRYQTLTPGAGWRALSAYVRATSGTPDGYVYVSDGTNIWTAQAALSTTYQRLIGAGNMAAGAGSFAAADSRSLGGGPAAGARDVRVSLVQLETGRYPTSPIVTAGATATRAADSLTLASAGVPAGMLTGRGRFAQFSPAWETADLASGDERWLLSLGGASNGIRVRHDGSNVLLEAVAGGAVKASKSFGTVAKNALVGPLAWDPAAGIVYIDGVAGSAGTAWTWSAADLRVGGQHGGSNEVDARLGALGGW